MAEQQRQAPEQLEEWVRRVSVALDLPASFSTDIPGILDLARDAAHGVARPAAPLTTFLVGYAAGLQAGDADDVDRLSAIASALAIASDSAIASDASIAETSSDQAAGSADS